MCVKETVLEINRKFNKNKRKGENVNLDNIGHIFFQKDYNIL